MTIAAGWRDREHVFMVVDSLLTYAGTGAPPPLRTDATFLERSQETDRRSEETGCKVFNLGSGVIATYVGAAGPAVGALRQIRIWLQSGRSLREIMRTIGPGEAQGNFQILIGGGRDKDPQLYHLSSDASWRELYEDRVPTVLGSLPEEGKEFVRRAAVIGYGIPPFWSDPDQLLAAMLMSLQALGRRVDLTRDKAGGAFFGMRSSAGVVHPQQDILYAAFDKADLSKGIGHEFALVGIRGDALVSWPLGRNVAVYVSDVSSATDEEVERLVRDSPLAAESAPFICLIEKRIGALFCVDCRKNPPAKYVRFVHSTEGFAMTIQPDLMARIGRIPDATLPLPTEVLHSFMAEPSPQNPP